ncbi:methyltransferase [Candidatus Omnitrophota bacterium]
MYKYTIRDKNETILFESKKSVFYPTDTSSILIEACRKAIISPKKILDLGCGCGLVGITLARLGLCKGPLFASDISREAVDLARKNAEKMSVEYVARCGSLFEPWKDQKFDVIVDDVAGISDDVAKISPWYPEGVPCDAGRGGAKWIVRVIEQSKDYLTDGGMLIFPVLSLSNEGEILQALKKTYSSHEMLAKKDWFLPDRMAEKTDILTPLINDGSINCQKKYGKWIWSTYIYRANS